MGLVSRLYPSSIHLVSIFSPPSDVAAWAFLFQTLGGEEEGVLSSTKGSRICLEESVCVCVCVFVSALRILKMHTGTNSGYLRKAAKAKAFI